MPKNIRLIHVRQNNLKSISVEFPARKLSVVTGLSGSGKSSLVFDTLYAEGQRRYVESLSTYTRQFLEKMPKPDLDTIENIPPAIALEQKNHVVNSRSTVGTQTEIVDYLRVLFSKIGQTFCTRCSSPVQQINAQSILEWAVQWLPRRKALIVAPLLRPSPAPDGGTAKGGSKKGKSKKKDQEKDQKQKSGQQKFHKGAKTDAGKGKTLQPGSAPGPMDAWELSSSLVQVLKEQGFQRILLKSSKGSRGESGESEKSGKKGTSHFAFEVVDLEETDPLQLGRQIEKSKVTEVYLIVDRLRLTPSSSGASAFEDDDGTRARIRDSIEQALAIGRGEVAFFDMDPDEAEDRRWKVFNNRFACIQCGLEHRIPEPHLFSFNSPLGACHRCSGFGFTLDLDEALVVPDPSKTLKNGAIDPFAKPSLSDWQTDLFRFAERHGISIGKRYLELTSSQKNLIWEGDPNDPTFPGILACFEELKRWKYKLHIRVFIRRYQSQSLCPDCKGARLKAEALAVRVGNQTIAQVLHSPIHNSLQWIRSISLSPSEKKIAQEVLFQVERRLAFLDEVGVGYLTLDRLTKSLSGGEFQRINLATQLGNGLCGTLYVLDEPSIGLHAADTQRLIRVLERLRDQGNSLVVVEHDLEVMKAADWLVELGPGAGKRGGELMAQGPASVIAKTPGSITGKYISGAFRLERDRPLRPPAKKFLKIEGCRENNLKNLRVEFPLERFIVVTGVSGSGKSTLVHKTLYHALSHFFYRTHSASGNSSGSDSVGSFDHLYGAEQLGGVVLLDQSSIGKTSRSNAATYLKAWDEVRRVYANQVLSHRRGYTPQHFSFNVDGGRCPVCKGEGEITLDMHFMAEVRLPCEECQGKRFKKSILDVTYRGKNVYQLLQTTIDEAFELFRDNPILARKFGVLRDVGLGYLQVGQSAPTLSGGESQRLKIAASLDDQSTSNLLYIFDEPTTGLHLEDIKKLMTVVQDLVEARHSVILIEHHLDVIAQADWVIDLGPGGGTAGGELVAQGPPSRLIEHPTSTTATMLKAQGYQFSQSLRSV